MEVNMSSATGEVVWMLLLNLGVAHAAIECNRTGENRKAESGKPNQESKAVITERKYEGFWLDCQVLGSYR